ncbi:YhbY family RNA-binding protein [Natronolimnohabitans sp. A-GB9]|uniref:YhbY family RNA-binding protein n=1 Tax=Natronolimnohabitans sp. A-GB9 TaxID=3069757 RepID=UPI0027B4A535|nr:YhbY family RNA-binding protein [Natronolimnohabitans sp. A-GB9]MDQ2052778.1 YhbY family RNA-binding protein [Natronolimnohabitans sp. A-GB9]
MDKQQLKQEAHDLDVTVWVGKSGLESVVDELDDQLTNRDLVKVKFLRAARAGSSTEEKAADLADRVDADLIDTRGHTAVLYR